MSSGQSRSDAWLLDFPRVRQPARRSLFAILCFHLAPYSRRVCATLSVEWPSWSTGSWSPASRFALDTRDVTLCDVRLKSCHASSSSLSKTTILTLTFEKCSARAFTSGPHVERRPFSLADPHDRAREPRDAQVHDAPDSQSAQRVCAEFSFVSVTATRWVFRKES